jgi:hypothetical protein
MVVSSLAGVKMRCNKVLRRKCGESRNEQKYWQLEKKPVNANTSVR